MDRLSLVLTLPVGATLTGAFAIIAFSFGLYGWGPVLVAAIAGFALAWPASWRISRRIKRKDPHFDHTRAKKKEGPLPDPTAREV